MQLVVVMAVRKAVSAATTTFTAISTIRFFIGRQNNGSAADSIVFFVSYKNDPWYPDDGYAKYKVSGIRYSGLVEND